MVSAWSTQPQRPCKTPAEVVPLAPKGQKRNQEEQCPITENFARTVKEPVWVTDWHVSYRGSRGVVTAGRGHEHRNVHCCPRKASQPFPIHLHHPTAVLGPKTATSPCVSVRGVSEKLRGKDRYRAHASRKQNG